jgi:hypothetical protein
MPHLTAVHEHRDAVVEAWAHIAHAATRALAVPGLDTADRDDLVAVRASASKITGMPIVETVDQGETAAMLRISACLASEVPYIEEMHWRHAIETLAEGLQASASRNARMRGV